VRLSPLALAVLAGALAARGADAQGGSIAGRVRAPGGVPLRGAQVLLDDSLVAVADDSGKFLVANVQKGTHALRVRAIGFGPVQNALRVISSERVEREFNLAVNADTLAAVTIVGERGRPIPARLRDYEDRRNFGIGHFVGASILDKPSTYDMATALRGIPALAIRRGRGSAATAINTREQCPVTVFLDGNPVRDFDLGTISPNSVYGVEYYSGPATVPSAYNRTGHAKCGVMLIWSK
jgi:hypothetical protein